MGSVCSSQPRGDRKIDAEITKQLMDDKNKQQYHYKVLLFGPPRAGKNTLIKQLQFLYGRGFNVLKRSEFIPYIHQHTIKSMQSLISHCKLSQLSSIKAQHEAKYLREIDCTSLNQYVAEDIIEAIQCLWKEDIVHDQYKYHIHENSAQFFDSIHLIIGHNYVPTDKHIMSVVSKSGYSEFERCQSLEYKFEIRGNIFHIINPCGNHSSWKKYLNLFEICTTMIFIADLSIFDVSLSPHKIDLLVHGFVDLLLWM